MAVVIVIFCYQWHETVTTYGVDQWSHKLLKSQSSFLGSDGRNNCLLKE